MQINNNLNAMNTETLKLNNLAQSVASVSTVTPDAQQTNQEVTPELLNAIIEQIPTVISYEANVNVIKTQNAVHDTLLDIKA